MKKSIPFLIFVLFLTALVPSASADSESLMVIVVEEDREYGVGDRVNLTIHVFYEGKYVDADEIKVTVEAKSTRNVTATRTDTGRYDASFTIDVDDVSYDDVEARVRVEYGEFSAGEWARFQVYRLTVTAAVNNPAPARGETVEVTAVVRNDSAYYDPDEITISVEVEDEGPDEEEELEVRKTGIGVYKANYTISPQDNESHTYDFYARIKDGELHDYHRVEAELVHYLVWYRNTTDYFNDSNPSFDLFVSDMKDRAVVNASVMFEYWLDTKSRATPRDDWDLKGTTDSTGRVSFEIDHELSDIEEIDIEGRVEAGNTQYFRGEINYEDEGWETWERYNNPDPEPDSHGLDVVMPSKRYYYEPEKESSVDFRAYMDGEPYTGNLTAFGFTHHEMVVHETVEIEDGDFSLEFRTPPLPDRSPTETLELEFQVYGDDRSWLSEEWMTIAPARFPFDFELKFDIESLNIGERTTVVIDNEEFKGYTGGVSCWPYQGKETTITSENYMEIMKGMWEGWECWSGHDMGSMAALSDHNGTGELSGELYLPEFWSDEERFMVFVGIYDPLGEDILLTLHYGGAVLEEGEGTSGEEEEDDGGFLPGFTGLELVSGLLAVAVLHKIGRKNKKQS